VKFNSRALVIFTGLAGLLVTALVLNSPSPQLNPAQSGVNQAPEKPVQMVSPRPPENLPPNQPPPPSVTTNPISTSSQASVPARKSLREEVIQVLQERYAEPAMLTPHKLDQAAMQGVLTSMSDSVQLLEPKAAAADSQPTHPAINSVTVLNPSIGYLRVEKIDPEVAATLDEEIHKLTREKNVRGLILDLRFAQGNDFSSVPAIASIFIPDATMLFRIQRGKSSQNYQISPSTGASDIPLLVLINHETKGAAEALAAVLQDQHRALLIGNSATAGQLFETSDVTLSNGQILRLATGKIILGHQDGSFLKEAHPDVTIVFDAMVERKIYNQPFRPPEPRLEKPFSSEAILTGREISPPLKDVKAKNEPDEPPSNGDTVLLSAIDLLKSIQALGLLPSKSSTFEGGDEENHKNDIQKHRS